MEWRQYIHSDPNVLLGKPVVKNTRLSVDFILELFASGWVERDILNNYPSLTSESLQSVFAFSAEVMRQEALFLIPRDRNNNYETIGK